MTKDELWKIYATKNPSFEGDGEVTMTAKGLKKLFEQTWDQAQEHGKALGVASQKLNKTFDSFFRP